MDSPNISIISDNASVSEDLEVSFEALRMRSDHQKSLLIKAKLAIAQYRSRVESLEKELEREKASGFKKFEGMEEVPTPIGILARVKIDSDIWCCIRTTEATTEWHVSDKLNLKAFVLPDVIQTNAVAKSEEEISGLNKQLTNCLLQVEQLKKLAAQKDEKVKQYETAYSTSKLILERISDYLECDEISVLESIDSQINSFSKQGEVAEHLTKLHKSCIHLSKRLIHTKKENQTQDHAWRATCDSLMNEKEELRSTIKRLRQDIQRKSEEQQQELDKLKTKQSSQSLDHAMEIEKLSEEIKKSVNIPYLRHVLLQFFTTSDRDVQDRLLQVITNLLSFDEKELAAVKSTRVSKGVLSSIFRLS